MSTWTSSEIQTHREPGNCVPRRFVRLTTGRILATAIILWTFIATFQSHSISSVHAEGKQESAGATSVEKMEFFFDGNILLLEVDESNAVESDSSTVIIEKARLLKVGGRHFIIGQTYTQGVPESYGAQSVAGATRGIPWDRVVGFYAMPPKDFEVFVKEWLDESNSNSD